MISGSVGSLEVKLFTKQPLYAVPSTPISVPKNVDSKGLTGVVNRLLRESKGDDLEHKDFSFIIDGELLCGDLSKLLAHHNVSLESSVEIEYVEATPPPKPENCLLHDDWVSAIHSSDKWFVTGCYDSTIHLWSNEGQHMLSIQGHRGPVKGISWTSAIADSDEQLVFASVSQDQTVVVWKWHLITNRLEKIQTCYGHMRSAECLAFNKEGEKFATGSWDSLVKVWAIGDASTDPESSQSTKRAKLQQQMDEESSKSSVPLTTLQGHREGVSSVQWLDSDIMSGSWDHTVKVWDVETGGVKMEIVTNKAVFTCQRSNLNRLILVAGPDRHIKLYDPRSNEGNVIKKKFSSHDKWIQTVKWSPTDPFLFLSGSFDNRVKMWDVRNENTPIYEMSRHEDRVLCCDWSTPKVIASGGCDNTLRIYDISSLDACHERNKQYYSEVQVLP